MTDRTQNAEARVVFNTTSRHASRVILSRLSKVLEFELVELYPDQGKGCEASIQLEIQGKAWSDRAIALISLAQTVGHSWTLTGDIDTEVDLSCAKFSESGIKFMWIQMEREKSSS